MCYFPVRTSSSLTMKHCAKKEYDDVCRKKKRQNKKNPDASVKKAAL